MGDDRVAPGDRHPAVPQQGAGVRVPEAIIRSANAAESHPRPGGPAGKDAHPVTLDALIPMGLAQSPLAVVMFDTGLRVAWVNQAAECLSDGIPAAGWPVRRLGEVLPCMDAELIERSLRQGLATGEPGAELEGGRRGGHPGEARLWSRLPFRLAKPDRAP